MRRTGPSSAITRCALSTAASLYEFAVLPLWRGDDPAGSFIACRSYESFDRLHIPDMEPVAQRKRIRPGQLS